MYFWTAVAQITSGPKANKKTGMLNVYKRIVKLTNKVLFIITSATTSTKTSRNLSPFYANEIALIE